MASLLPLIWALVERFSGVSVTAAAAVPLTVMGAMNRYPRRGKVSTNLGFSAESPSTSRILLIAVFRL